MASKIDIYNKVFLPLSVIINLRVLVLFEKTFANFTIQKNIVYCIIKDILRNL